MFDPQNYLQKLPSLSLPYVSSLSIPHIGNMIKPSPVVATKVVNVVTKYVTTNPVCIKVTSSKPLCKPKKGNPNLNFLITKEYFVKDRSNREGISHREHRKMDNIQVNEKNETSNNRSFELEASELQRSFMSNTKTPELSNEKVQELLIEDRLDQLEQILPHYTRRRKYETSTVTITKTRVDNSVKATLLVKNCVPVGYSFCPPKRRRSKITDVNNLDSNLT